MKTFSHLLYQYNPFITLSRFCQSFHNQRIVQSLIIFVTEAAIVGLEKIFNDQHMQIMQPCYYQFHKVSAGEYSPQWYINGEFAVYEIFLGTEILN